MRRASPIDVWNKDIACATFGVPFDPTRIPDWFDFNWLADLSETLTYVGQWSSTGYTRTINLELSDRINIGLTAVPVGVNEFLCPVNLGLAVRLYFLLQLLFNEKGELLHISDPVFYGDDIRGRPRISDPPEPISDLARDSLDSAAFWASMDLIRRQYGHIRSPLVEEGRIFDVHRDAVIYCALHEAIHVLRKHDVVVDAAVDKERIKRGAEVDADYRAGMWMGALNVNMARGHPEDDWIYELTWRSAYAFCLAIGLFDIEQRAISDFSTGVYHHPSARALTSINGLIHGTTESLSHSIKSDLDKCANEAAGLYNGNINELWRKLDPKLGKSRPSSIYFPLTMGIPEAAYLPLSRLFGSGYTLKTISRPAYDDLMEFKRQHDAIFANSVL